MTEMGNCDRVGRKRWAATSTSLLGAVLVLTLGLVGCGESRPLAPVEGQVLYKGKPLEFGSVTFQPPGGQPARADIGPGGKFVLNTPGEGDGAVIGLNKVRVTCYESQAPGKTPASEGEGGLGKSLIPERYSSYETSGITMEVKSGQNEPLIIELTD